MIDDMGDFKVKNSQKNPLISKEKRLKGTIEGGAAKIFTWEREGLIKELFFTSNYTNFFLFL